MLGDALRLSETPSNQKNSDYESEGKRFESFRARHSFHCPSPGLRTEDRPGPRPVPSRFDPLVPGDVRVPARERHLKGSWRGLRALALTLDCQAARSMGCSREDYDGAPSGLVTIGP
jgi:hypothetical protein